MTIRISPADYGIRSFENLVSAGFIQELRLHQVLEKICDFILPREVLIILDFLGSLYRVSLWFSSWETRLPLHEGLMVHWSADHMTFLGLLDERKGGLRIVG